MTDLVITDTDVVQGAGARVIHGILGETVTAGQSVRRDLTDGGKYKLAESDRAEADGEPAGIALNGGAINQPVTIQYDGEVDLGAVLTVGVIYILSQTLGGIEPCGDQVAGGFTTVLGIATSANNLDIGIQISGARFV